MEQQYKTDAEIYAVLEREIIDLTIRPGSSLSENPLCARFGAPRSLIRVVLQKLQENGLVRIVPYKGTTVTRLHRRIVDELIYERTAVEGRILRDFAPNATPAQRAQIRARVDAYEALARAENPDFNKLYEMDCRLHETWFAAMDKMYLWSTLQNAHADYSRFRMLDTMTTGGLDEVIADHRNHKHGCNNRNHCNCRNDHRGNYCKQYRNGDYLRDRNYGCNDYNFRYNQHDYKYHCNNQYFCDGNNTYYDS